MNSAQASKLVKRLAREQGFDACGISAAGFLEEEATGLENWLNAGFHGTMSWMERHFDERLDPRKLVPGAKSVISVVLNYFLIVVYRYYLISYMRQNDIFYF